MQISEANLQDPADRNAIIQLNQAFAHDGGIQLAPEQPAALDTLLATHPTIFAFLAWDEEHETIGYALCHFTISSFAGVPAANVHDLYVVPGARGTGVAQALMEQFESKARAHGCCKLTLEVAHNNVVAQRLYRALGFDDYQSDAESAQTWFWVKMLA